MERLGFIGKTVTLARASREGSTRAAAPRASANPSAERGQRRPGPGPAARPARAVGAGPRGGSRARCGTPISAWFTRSSGSGRAVHRRRPARGPRPPRPPAGPAPRARTSMRSAFRAHHLRPARAAARGERQPARVRRGGQRLLQGIDAEARRRAQRLAAPPRRRGGRAAARPRGPRRRAGTSKRRTAGVAARSTRWRGVAHVGGGQGHRRAARRVSVVDHGQAGEPQPARARAAAPRQMPSR